LYNLEKVDKEVFEAINNEIKRQREKLELIASENYASPAVLEAQGSVLTNKYAEGYPGKRYYGGCEYVDVGESLAIQRAKEIFKSDHANVQLHSGSQANMAVYFAVLNFGDTILGMNLSHGGHLTHGHPMNFSGKNYKIVPYGVNRETEVIDYDELSKLAKETKPKLIIAGASAYPRIIDFEKFSAIAKEVGAMLMVDMAHIAGLIAVNLHPNPVPYAEFVTSTTHKTLRGPRGGFILCKERYAKEIDKTVFPGIQGGPLMHVIAAKAVAFKEAMMEGFKGYQKQVVKNATHLGKCLENEGFRLVSGGTDNHLMLVDLTPKNVTGKEAETVLDKAGITVNKNTIPFDTQKPFIASGIRIGTPAVTTRGMKEKEMEKISQFISRALKYKDNDTELDKVREEVKEFTSTFPLFNEDFILE